jgi:hypothetical protein
MYVSEPANLHIFYVHICRCVVRNTRESVVFGDCSIKVLKSFSKQNLTTKSAHKI